MNRTLLCWALKAGLLVWPEIFAHLKAMISLCVQGPEAISRGHMPWLQGPKSVISFSPSSSSFAGYLIAGRESVVTMHFRSQGSTIFLIHEFLLTLPWREPSVSSLWFLVRNINLLENEYFPLYSCSLGPLWKSLPCYVASGKRDKKIHAASQVSSYFSCRKPFPHLTALWLPHALLPCIWVMCFYLHCAIDYIL